MKEVDNIHEPVENFSMSRQKNIKGKGKLK